MDYIKQEDTPPQLYTTLAHHVSQSQQLPLNIVEQIQLAVQNNMASISDPQLSGILIKNHMEQNHLQIMKETVPIIYQPKNTAERSNLILDHRSTPMLDHRNTPIMDHRNTPLVDHRNTPMLDHRNTPMLDHRNTPIMEHRDQLMDQRTTIIQEHKSTMVHNNEGRIDLLDHRVVHDNRQRLELGDIQNHRVDVDGRLVQGLRVQGMVGHAAGLVLPDVMEGELPMPFQIKMEQDVEENPYFYDHMLQAYAANGTIQMDPQTNVITSVPNETHALQYMFNGQITNINVPAATVDPYVRQQQFFQSYVTDNPEGSAQNLVVHRQFDNVVYVDDTKRQKSEVEKLNPSVLGNNTSENAKPKVYYYDQECYKSENDASVQNKIQKSDDVAYKTMLEAEYANIKGEYVCGKCNGIFPSKRGLKQHAKSCNFESDGASEKSGKFGCVQCPYKCQSQAILKIHERTHTGEKPFSCSFCDYKSGQKNNVAKHILVHMKEKPFRCQYCEYRCAQKNNLVVHERTHTGFKPFACTLCDYKTVQKPNLVKHMYLHTGQKPFSCDICSYKCVQKTNLTKHKQRHLNEKSGERAEYVNRNADRPYRPRQKTFKCELCNFKCVQKQGLEKHIQFKHDQSSEASESVQERQFEQGLNLMKEGEGNVEDLCTRKEEMYTEGGVDAVQEQIAS